MDGPSILAASMSVPQPRGESRTPWQYHSRSDLHSKVACWGVLVDLLTQSNLLWQHATRGKVLLGINHKMRDFQSGREKALDLVIARPSAPTRSRRTLADLAEDYSIVLTSQQASALAGLPPLYVGPVGAVLVALEAKAAMTAFVKALPRLYDELNSSHQTVHAASSNALAVGLAMVNASASFISPDLNRKPSRTKVVSTHRQPENALRTIDKIREIPRRSSASGHGFDGLGVVVVSAVNDGKTPIQLVSSPPAPQPGDVLHYETMITRVASEYDATWRNI
jgi:hypothetical protein